MIRRMRACYDGVIAGRFVLSLHRNVAIGSLAEMSILRRHLLVLDAENRFAARLLPALAVFAWLGSCVTINVYFPAAAAEQAADRIIQNVLGAPPENETSRNGNGAEDQGTGARLPSGFSPLDLLIPAAHAQAEADLEIDTPAIRALEQRMRDRQQTVLALHFASGALGFGNDGLVAVRERTALPLAARRLVEAAVAAENQDRRALYREIAVANGHPEWEDDIRRTFARRWIAMAPPGWYYQNEQGVWTQK